MITNIFWLIALQKLQNYETWKMKTCMKKFFQQQFKIFFKSLAKNSGKFPSNKSFRRDIRRQKFSWFSVATRDYIWFVHEPTKRSQHIFHDVSFSSSRDWRKKKNRKSSEVLAKYFPSRPKPKLCQKYHKYNHRRFGWGQSPLRF